MAKDAGERLRNLDEKLDAIMKRLDIIEQVLLMSGEYPYIASAVRSMKQGVALYSEPLKVLERLTTARRFLRRRTASRDELSQTIIGILAVRGSLKISQVTRELQAVRGKASRRIVRDRLRRLQAEGAVREAEGLGHRYELAQ